MELFYKHIKFLFVSFLFLAAFLGVQINCVFASETTLGENSAYELQPATESSHQVTKYTIEDEELTYQYTDVNGDVQTLKYTTKSATPLYYNIVYRITTPTNNRTTSPAANITSHFVGNYVSGSSSSYGGAIYNKQKIVDIESDFIDNYVYCTTSASYNSLRYAVGGAIYNENSIGRIKGDFIGNYAYGRYSTSNNYNYYYGGAIYNVGIIDSVLGLFANNSSGYGGAIYNNYKISSVLSDFYGNYVQNGSGGAIYNSKDGAIESLKGDYVGNYVDNSGLLASGGSVYNSGKIGVIESNFIGNYARGIYKSNGSNYTAGGGAIYNSGEIQSIVSSFSNNFVDSDTSDRFFPCGGAIYNSGKIDTIKSDFISNQILTKNSYEMFGGAIYNTGEINLLEGNFINNSSVRDSSSPGYYDQTEGGAIYNSGTIHLLKGTFIGNYAFAKGSASAGAISISASSSGLVNIVDSIFIGNYASATTYSSTGGAMYIYMSGYGTGPLPMTTISNTIFESNYAISSNSNAYGGAMYFTYHTSYRPTVLTLNNVSFMNNYAIYNGTSSSTYARGGAIYTKGDINFNISDKVVFSGNYIYNNNTKLYEGIYMDSYSGSSTITFNMLDGGLMTFDDYISAYKYSATVQILGDNGAGLFVLNNKILTAEVIVQDTTLKLGSFAYNNYLNARDDWLSFENYFAANPTKEGSFDIFSTVSSLSLVNANIDVRDSFYTNYLMGKLSSDEDSEYFIDVSLLNSTSDKFTVKKGSSGVITIKDIAYENISSDRAYSVTVQVLFKENTADNIVLALSPDVEWDKITNLTDFYSEENGYIFYSDSILGSRKVSLNDTKDSIIITAASSVVSLRDINIMSTPNVDRTYIFATPSSENAVVVVKDNVNLSDNNDSDKVGTGSGNVTIKGYDSNAQHSVIDLTDNQYNNLEGFYISNSNTTFNLKNLTIRNGIEVLSLVNAMSVVNVENVRFENNKAKDYGDYGYGGAVYNTGFMTIADSVFRNNYAKTLGGAIYNTRELTSVSGSFISNTAGEFGGAIYNAETIQSLNADFEKNSAISSGGAIYNTEIISSVIGDFTGNYSGQRGGAIYNEGTVLSVTGNFTGNYSLSKGGAIYNTGTVETLTGGFVSNYAGDSGGAMYNTSAMRLNESSMIGNYVLTDVASAHGGAIYTLGDLNFYYSKDAAISGNYVQSGSNREYEAIYAADSNILINMNLSNGMTFTLDDSINGVSGYNINIIGTGNELVNYNGNIKNANINISNLSLNMASFAYANYLSLRDRYISYDEYSLANSAKSGDYEAFENSNLTLSNVVLYMQDNLYTKYDFGTLKLNENVSAFIDMSIENESADSFVVKSGSQGTIMIKDINYSIPDKKDYSVIIKILYKENSADNIVLELNPDMVWKEGVSLEDYGSLETGYVFYNDSIIGSREIKLNDEKDSIVITTENVQKMLKYANTLSTPNSSRTYLFKAPMGIDPIVTVKENVNLSNNRADTSRVGTGSGNFIIRGYDTNAEHSVIDLSDENGVQFQGFYITNANTNFNLENITIKNGENAVYANNSSSSVNIDNVIFDSNISVLYSNNTDLQIANSKFVNNYCYVSDRSISTVNGGVLYLSNTNNKNVSISADFKNNYVNLVRFLSSYSYTSTYINGGAIYNTGKIDSLTSNFIGNYISASVDHYGNYIYANGGAIYNSDTILRLTGTFDSNHIVSNDSYGKQAGGAIYNTGSITIVDSLFKNNYIIGSYVYGGAIYNTGTMSIDNTVFTGNYVKRDFTFGTGVCGGIYNTGQILFIKNSEFSENTGGALYNTNKIGDITDSIFNGNTGNAIYNTGSILSIRDTSFVGTDSQKNSSEVGCAGIRNIGTIGDVYNLTFENNRGEYSNNGVGIYNSGTMGEISSSRFIGAYVFCAYGGGIYNSGSIVGIKDSIFAGNYRGTDGSSTSACGLGIYNVGSLGYITGEFYGNYASSGSSGGAIANVFAKINYIEGVFSGNYVDNCGGAIYNSGNWGEITKIMGEFSGNGTSEQTKVATEYGGAIYNSTLIEELNATFNSNVAQNGGAIYNSGKFSNIESSLFSSNQAYYGGAIYNKGIINSITKVNFADNYSSFSSSYNSSSVYGGGIYNSGRIYLVSNTSFTGNYSTTERVNTSNMILGGAIYNTGVIDLISSVEFIGNYTNSPTNSKGGAIYNTGDVTFENVIFTNNYSYAYKNPNYSSYNYYAKGGAIYNTGNIVFNVSDNIKFSGNYVQKDETKAFEGIYSEKTSLFTVNLLNAGVLTFDDYINGDLGYRFVINGENGAERFVLNNKIMNGNVSVLNTNILLASFAYNNYLNERDTYASFNDYMAEHTDLTGDFDVFSTSTVNIANSTVDLRDSFYTNYKMGVLTSDENTEYSIDLSILNEVSDTFAVKKGSSGVIKITNISYEQSDSEVFSAIIKVLFREDESDNIVLALDPNVAWDSNTTFVDFGSAETGYIFYNDSIIGPRNISLNDTKDSIIITAGSGIVSLRDVNIMSTPDVNRTYIFRAPTGVNTVVTVKDGLNLSYDKDGNLVGTGAGNFTVNGYDTDANHSVIDLYDSFNNRMLGFYLSNNGTTLNLNNLTIKNGYNPLYVLNSSAVVNINNVIFENNSAYSLSDYAQGGVIYNAGTVVALNAIFMGNYSANYGGAIYNTGNLTLNNPNIVGNYVLAAGTDANGGAIYNTGTITFNISDDVQLSGNYVQTTETKLYQLLFAGTSDSVINFNLSNGITLILEDSIDGVNGYNLNITGVNKEIVNLNTSITNANVSLSNIVLNIASYTFADYVKNRDIYSSYENYLSKNTSKTGAFDVFKDSNVNVSNVDININDGIYTTYTFGSLNATENVSLKIDLSIEDGLSDKIAVGPGSSGEIMLDEILYSIPENANTSIVIPVLIRGNSTDNVILVLNPDVEWSCSQSLSDFGTAETGYIFYSDSFIGTKSLELNDTRDSIVISVSDVESTLRYANTLSTPNGNRTYLFRAPLGDEPFVFVKENVNLSHNKSGTTQVGTGSGNFTVRGYDSDASHSIIDLSDENGIKLQGFYVTNANTNLTLENLTITRGNYAIYGYNSSGSSSINLNNVILRENLANNNGVAIYNVGTALSITDSQFIRNGFFDSINTDSSKSVYGGALFNESESVINTLSAKFIENYAVLKNSNKSTGTYTYGGAVYNAGTISNLTGVFEGNYSVPYNYDSYYGSYSYGYGGAIYNKGTIDSLNNAYLGYNYIRSDNYAAGGAIYNTNILNIHDTEFFGNYVSGGTSLYGGAVYNIGTTSILNSTFTNNYITGNYGYGGAIYNAKNLSILNSDFKYNYTAYTGSYAYGNGGAIYNTSALSIENSNFVGNYSNKGGAIYNTSSTFEKIVDSTFVGNYSGNYSGGAIYNTGTISSISNSEFVGNYVAYYTSSIMGEGGAIYNSGTITSITDVVFTGNYARSGGAIYNTGTIKTLSATFKDGILLKRSSENITNYGIAIYNAGTIENLVSTFNNNGKQYAYAKGAAIYNAGTIKVLDSIFSNNIVDSYGNYGGAVHNTNKIETVKGSFVGNISGIGGGLLNISEVKSTANTATVNLIESEFKGNYAGYGGAIGNYSYLDYSPSANSIVNIGTIKSIFEGNYATYGGGAIYNGSYANSTSNSIISSVNIDLIETSFSGHYLNYVGSGGAIYNMAYSVSSSAAPTSNVNITSIRGDFVGNYIKRSSYSGTTSYGGALANYSSRSYSSSEVYNNAKNAISIDSINGSFIGNYINVIVVNSSSSQSAYGGAISNNTADVRTSSITINSILGTFSGNYVQAGAYAYGGAIYNKYSVINSLDSSFINNYVISTKTSGNYALGGAIYTSGNITFLADGHQNEFSGNYTVLGNVKDDNAIYVDAISTTITFDMKNGGSFLMKDNIKGVAGYNMLVKGTPYTPDVPEPVSEGDEPATEQETVLPVFYLENMITGANLVVKDAVMDVNHVNGKILEMSLASLNTTEGKFLFSIDVDFDNLLSDTISTTNASSGLVYLNNLNIISGDYKDCVIQVLKTQNSDLQLAIGDELQALIDAYNAEFAEENNRTDVVAPVVDFDVKLYNYVGYTGALAIELTTTATENDSFKVITNIEGTRTLLDTLALLNQLVTDENREFNFKTESDIYTVISDLGNTAAGVLSINGISSSIDET